MDDVQIFVTAAMSAAVVSDECAAYNCTNCKAPCCCLHVNLTDLELANGAFLTQEEKIPGTEKTVRILARTKDGACVYRLPDGRCSIYATRPYVCRTYTCENDRERITDEARYETGVPNIKLLEDAK
jgi:Fe-S-cluster containining protein